MSFAVWFICCLLGSLSSQPEFGDEKQLLGGGWELCRISQQGSWGSLCFGNAGQRGREQLQQGEGPGHAANEHSLRQFPCVIKRAFGFGGDVFLCFCFFQCKILHAYWGSFCLVKLKDMKCLCFNALLQLWLYFCFEIKLRFSLSVPKPDTTLSLSLVGRVLLCQANQEGSPVYSAPSSLVYTSTSKLVLTAVIFFLFCDKGHYYELSPIIL